MPTIYNTQGRALPSSRYIYKRSDGNVYHLVYTTYDFTECVRYKRTNLRMSSSFIRAIKEFAEDKKNPCLVSKLLLHALSYKMYCAKDHINYISFRENKGLISFMPFGKDQEISPDGRWLLKGRQTMKPAKFARAILNPRLVKRLNDKHFNLFATKFKSFEESTESVLQPTTFTVAYTEKPDEWKFSTGSCMRNKPVQEFYSVFDCQPLIIKTKNNLISGRAILWNNVDLVDAVTNNVITTAPFLDRIYSPPEFADIFIKYAEENGYIHRGVSGGIGYIFHKGVKCNDVYVRTVGRGKFSNKWIPYMDTFRYGSCDEQTIYSHSVELDYRYIMDHTDGTARSNGYVKGHVLTVHDGFQAPENCIIWKNKYHLKGGRDTVMCREDGNYYHYSDPLIVDVDNIYYRRDSALLGTDYHTGNLCRKDMMVTRYTGTGKEVTVNKKYAAFYKDSPIPVDKVKTEYTFKPSTHKTLSKYDEIFYDEIYSKKSIKTIIAELYHTSRNR